MAPVEGSHKAVVVDVALVGVALVGSDSKPGQAVPVLDILAGPEIAASMEVVVKT